MIYVLCSLTLLTCELSDDSMTPYICIYKYVYICIICIPGVRFQVLQAVISLVIKKSVSRRILFRGEHLAMMVNLSSDLFFLKWN